MSGQLHTPAALPPGKIPDTHWIRCWVGPRTSLDDAEKRQFLPLPGLELRLLGRPARSYFYIEHAIQAPKIHYKIKQLNRDKTGQGNLEVTAYDKIEVKQR
jgi:hypothetical protein